MLILDCLIVLSTGLQEIHRSWLCGYSIYHPRLRLITLPGAIALCLQQLPLAWSVWYDV